MTDLTEAIIPNTVTGLCARFRMTDARELDRYYPIAAWGVDTFTAYAVNIYNPEAIEIVPLHVLMNDLSASAVYKGFEQVSFGVTIEK